MRPVPQQRSSTVRTSAASLLQSSLRWAAQRSWQPSTTISSYTPASREYGSAPFPPVVPRSQGSWPWPPRTPPTLGSPPNVLSPMGADDICSHLASSVQRPQTQRAGDDEEVRQSAGLLRHYIACPSVPSSDDTWAPRRSVSTHATHTPVTDGAGHLRNEKSGVPIPAAALSTGDHTADAGGPLLVSGASVQCMHCRRRPGPAGTRRRLLAVPVQGSLMLRAAPLGPGTSDGPVTRKAAPDAGHSRN